MYDAFISYAREDELVAVALQEGLRELARPAAERAALTIFRDETALGAGPLRRSLEQALDESKWFVLLCSPDAAASDWVGREIDRWKATHPLGRMILVLTNASFVWDPARPGIDWERSDAISRSLEGAFEEEPLYVDLNLAETADMHMRNDDFRDTVGKIAAPIHGVSKDVLEGEDIRQHREAGSKRVAQTSQLLSGTQRDLALLLATEAYDLWPTREAESALLAGLVVDSGEIAVRREHTDVVTGLSAVSGAGTIASIANDGKLIVWDIATRTPTVTFETDRVPYVYEVVLSADGRLVAMPGADGIRLWDVVGRTELASIVFPDTCGVSFDGPGSRIAAVAVRGELGVWDVETGTRLAAAEPDEPTAVAYSPSDDQLAVTTTTTVELWDARLVSRLDTLCSTEEYPAYAPQFSPDGAIVSAVLEGFRPQDESMGLNRFLFLAAETGELLAADEYGPRPVAPIGIAIDTGRGLVATWDESALTMHDIGEDSTIRKDALFTGVGPMRFADDGELLIAGREDGSLVFRSLHAAQPFGTWSALEHPAAVSAMAASRDGGVVASVGEGGAVRRWDLGPDDVSCTALIGHTDTVEAVAVNADGSMVASGGYDTMLRLWDSNGLESAAIEHPGWVTAVAFSPDGQVVASSWWARNTPTEIVLWDIASQKRTATFASGDIVSSLAFNRDGTLLASAGTRLRVWDVRSGDVVDRFEKIGDAANVAFSPDGTRLASTLTSVSEWDADGDDPVRLVYPGRSGDGPTSIAYSPDGRFLAWSIGADIHLWDRGLEQRFAMPFTAHGDKIRGGQISLAFARGGQALMSGGNDAFVRLWDLDAERWVAMGRKLAGRTLSSEERAQHVGPEADYYRHAG